MLIQTLNLRHSKEIYSFPNIFFRFGGAAENESMMIGQFSTNDIAVDILPI